MLHRLLFTLTAFLALLSSASRAENLKVVGWNLESGEAKPAYIGNHIANFKGIDLWGFSEVTANDAKGYATACAAGESGQEFKHFVGTTGGSDRLVIVYNATKLELLGQQELLNLNAQTGRAPLLGRFKIKSSGEVFIFMVNHLHRGNAAKRMEQTVGLMDWARQQPLPAILVGDYNFDVNVNTRHGNPAFQTLIASPHFHWVTPTPFRATHKAGSVLDFVFLSGPAKAWKASATVVALSDDAVDTLQSSDHRPVQAFLQTPTLTPPPKGPLAAAEVAPAPAEVPEALRNVLERQQKRDEIIKKLTAMEQDLARLRRMVKELADE